MYSGEKIGPLTKKPAVQTAEERNPADKLQNFLKENKAYLGGL